MSRRSKRRETGAPMVTLNALATEKDKEVVARIQERIRLSMNVHEAVSALLDDLENTHRGLRKEEALVTHLKIIERLLTERLDKTEEALQNSNLSMTKKRQCVNSWS